MKKIALLVLCARVLAACVSAEGDGVKVAKKYVKCEENRIEGLCEAYDEYLEGFEGEEFGSRVEAREALARVEGEVEGEYQMEKMRAESFHRKLRNKYVSNPEKNAEFQYAYENYYKANSAFDYSEVKSLKDRANVRIASIIPDEPSEEKMMNDLVGRTIKEQEGGYHKYGWKWVIEEGEVKSMQILEAETVDGKPKYRVEVILQASEGAAYKALANVVYHLPDEADDWSIEFVESLNVEIVKTGLYDNCISHSIIQGGWLLNRAPLKIVNNCDKGLQVGGRIRNENQWEKFVVNIKPNDSEEVAYGGAYRLDVHEYVIDFVELP